MPNFVLVITFAQLSNAMETVLSKDLSSTTITSETFGCAFAKFTTLAMFSSSLSVGIITVIIYFIYYYQS